LRSAVGTGSRLLTREKPTGDRDIDICQTLESLRERAAHFRRLAANASDSEVADTLNQIAEDMDAAMPIFLAGGAQNRYARP
jgi:hypothetical protein